MISYAWQVLTSSNFTGSNNKQSSRIFQKLNHFEQIWKSISRVWVNVGYYKSCKLGDSTVQCFSSDNFTAGNINNGYLPPSKENFYWWEKKTFEKASFTLFCWYFRIEFFKSLHFHLGSVRQKHIPLNTSIHIK